MPQCDSMERAIFMTGASGFLGGHLLKRLTAKAGRVICLGHRKPALAGTFEFVAGDLLDREACRRAMQGCDTVVHLAAATGKHRPDRFFKVNRDGTAALLQIARETPVERFLYVSSIAAKFENRFRY